MPRKIKQRSDSFGNPFPTRLRSLMKEGYTQQEVADWLGISRQVISLYASGKSLPDADSIVKLSKGFDVSTDYLLGISDEPKPAYAKNKLTKKSLDNLLKYDSLTVAYINYLLECNAFEKVKDDIETLIELLGKNKEVFVVESIGVKASFMIYYLTHRVTEKIGDCTKAFALSKSCENTINKGVNKNVRNK